ncbi:MAG TPA: dockerin type I domain-containing protein [Tepidisphaeraceae bacterium]|jgi:T5SS/PEP-CTERM-associated repeat protein|nr:dockerin type I domain-containing protein [Tepidisphaeraceae bacterium]
MLRSIYTRRVLYTAILAVASSAQAQVQFNDFSNTSSLQLNGNAAGNTNVIDGAVLRVTSNDTGEAGSAFTTTAYNLGSGFSTFFTFRISDFDNSGFYGADGMLFLVQNDPRGSTALGVSGGALGYSDPDNSPGLSIQNSAGIEFDTYTNEEYNDPDTTHVALDLNGSVTHSTNPSDPTFPVSMADNLNNQSLWYTWIDYNGSTIELRMSQDGVRPDAPTLSEPLTLNSAQTYFTGFTAGTGSGTENHDVLNWSFTNTYDPYGSVENVLTDAHADGDFLAGTSTGDWSDTNSWIDHQVPTNATNTYLDTFDNAYTLNVGAGTNAVAQNVTIHGSDSAPVTLTIHDGGTLNVAADFKAGGIGDSAATITVDGAGSQLNVVGSIYLSSDSNAGPGSASTISVTNGGSLSSLDAHIGALGEGVASVSVDGSGSTWTVRQYLYAGEYGAAASLSFTNGAVVNDGEAHIGNTSPATVLIDDSTWHTDNTLYVGEYALPSSVTGQNGAIIEAYDVRISHDAQNTETPSTVTIDGTGSHLNVADEILVGGEYGNGKLTISNNASASSSDLYIAGDLPDTDSGAATDDATSIGTVVVDAGSLDNSGGSTNVGRNGTGKLIVKNGGQVVSDTAVIGDNSTGNGLVFVGGKPSGVTSSWQVNNDLVVGRTGIGALTVKSDMGTAFVTASQATVGWSDAVSGATGTGTLTVDGAHSSMTIYGDNAQLYIGRDAGNGSVTVSNGGSLVIAPTSVSNTGGLVYVGEGANSTGSLVIDGSGSQLLTSAKIYAGFSGTGSITVSNGGLLITAENLSQTDSSGTLGRNVGSSGTATITDAGSKWTQDGTLNVGFAGTGNLMVLNGGELDSVDGVIARNPGSTGTATVDGNDSKWSLSDILSVGGTATDAGGTGQVTISNGGFILANYGVDVWSGSSVLIQNSAVLQSFLTVIDGSLQITDGSAAGLYNVTGSGSVSIVNNASLVTLGIRIAQLTVDGGGLYVQFNSSDPYPSRIGSLTITNGGVVDLDNNPLILDYTSTSPLSAVRGYLHDGLMTSASATNDAQHRTGLAYVEASKLLGISGAQTALWYGETVDATTVLVKYTWLGDANLDGKINADDFAMIDRGFAKHMAAGTAYWSDGDFNYDGVVNSADYMIIDRDFALQSGALSPAFLAEREAQFGDAYVSQLLTSIPEPSMVGLVIGTLAMTRRKRK